MNTYNFTFTLDQVNEIVACMNNGPFGQVSRMLAEFRRQMAAQDKPPPEEKPPAQPPQGNGETAITR